MPFALSNFVWLFCFPSQSEDGLLSPDTEEVVEEGKEEEEEEEEVVKVEDDVNMGADLGHALRWEWNLRRKNIEHDYAIT